MSKDAEKALQEIPTDVVLQTVADFYKHLAGQDLVDVNATHNLLANLHLLVHDADRFDEITQEWQSAHQDNTQLAVLEIQAISRTLSNPRAQLYVDRILSELIESLYKKAWEPVRQQAEQDSLTGLLNHNTWMERYQKELGRNIRYGHPLTVLLLDLDGFKNVNDTHGHQAGDSVLTRVAEVLKMFTREHDIVGRLGGDEFGVCMIESDRVAAEELVRRLRIHLAPIRRQLGLGDNFGVSYGWASTPEDSEDAEELLSIADKRLYGEKGVEITSGFTGLPSTSIVVCDDDPHIVQLCKTVLEQDGYTVHQALRGDDAVRLCQEHNPEMILLDINMPGMDGWEVIHHLRADDNTRYIPVVIMTGQDDEDSLRQAVDTGAIDYLPKPFAPSTLLAVTNTVLMRDLF